MKELSLHIMDIIENSIRADADLICLEIEESFALNQIRISIKDNGGGIPANLLCRVTDPFYTTRPKRRVGLGLSLFREASRRCEGSFSIESKEGEGTMVEALFMMDHIDLAPMGDIRGTMISLIMGNPGVEFVYTHKAGARCFHLDTRIIRSELEGVPFNHPKVMGYISGVIEEGLAELKRGALLN